MARTNADSPAPTQAQLDRKRRSELKVKALGLPTLDTLPVVEEENKVLPRSVDEVASRCVANTVCAIKGETNDQKLVDGLLGTFDASPALSPAERAFIGDTSSTEQARLDFGWRYECTHVFLWALGYLPQLAVPDQQSDVAKEVGLIRKLGKDGFRAGAKLRPTSELLDESDYYYRLHWATVDLHLKKQNNPKANDEIIAERHRALNWLIRYMNQAWDDVSTDT